MHSTSDSRTSHHQHLTDDFFMLEKAIITFVIIRYYYFRYHLFDVQFFVNRKNKMCTWD